MSNSSKHMAPPVTGWNSTQSVRWVFMLSLVVILITSCRSDITLTPFYEDIYEGRNESITEYVLIYEDEYSMFADILKVAGLDGTLTAYNPHGNDYTLFLPVNDAIESYVANAARYGSFEELLEDIEFVRHLARYHVVNRAIQKNDFPYGALSDTTLSGDQLTIGFSGDIGSTVLKVNNEASIIEQDIELINGYIHVIDKMLIPVIFSSFEWLKAHPEFSIFTEALEVTGLRDTFLIQIENGTKYTSNTLLVETDEVFALQEIYSLDDLKQQLSPDNQEYTDYSNNLYQFVAYHILEEKMYLNDFEGENTNYNTYANLPVQINGTGLDIKINSGVEVFDSVVTENNIIYIDWVGILYDMSNVATRNGAIHRIEQMMKPYRPKSIQRIFQFYEESLIYDARQNYGTYRFDTDDLEGFEVIGWRGIEEIEYVNSSSDLPNVWGNDYLQLEGEFIVTYQLSKILPGNYLLSIRANDDYYDNATIQVFLDGKSMGGNIDLSSNPNKNSSMNTFDIGQVVFDNYEAHELKIQTLIPGRFTWDALIFQPN